MKKIYFLYDFKFIFLLIFLISNFNVLGQANGWITTGNATAWFTPSNWSLGVTPAINQIAQFGAQTGSSTFSNITFPSNFSILGIEMTAARPRNLDIGGSGGSGGPNFYNLTLLGTTINAIPNTIIRNECTSLLTIKPNQSGANYLDLFLGNSITNSINIDGGGGIAITSKISGTSSLTKAGIGSGKLTLSGLNNYTGATIINSGTLSFPTIANGGIASGIGASSNNASNLVLGGGELEYTGVSNSTNRNFTLSTGTSSQIDVTTNTLTISGAASATNGQLQKWGAGKLELTGANLYTGITDLYAGTLQLNKTGGNTLPITNNIFVTGTGVFRVSTNQTINDITINGGSIVVDPGVTLRVNGTFIVNGTCTISGTIAYGTTANLIYTGTVTRTVGGEWPNVDEPKQVIIGNSSIISLAQNETVLGDIYFNTNGLLRGAGFTLTVNGNWQASTGGNYTGLTNNASAVIFTGTGSHTFFHTGGATFRNLSFTGAGTYEINDDINISVNTLTISDGVVDMKTNTLDGTGNLTMTGGLLQQAKLNTTLPELTGLYTNTGGSFELNGLGNQTLKGGETYANLIFSESGTKILSASINPPTNTINGTITVANSAVLNVGNQTMGGAATNLTMTGNSRYITAGASTKPDASNIYSLGANTTIEFTNTAGGQQDIRLAPLYANVTISGSSVGLSGVTSILNMQAGTTFQVTATGTFNVKNTNGFAGTNFTAINSLNNPSIFLQSGSTINYDGAAQVITNTLAYQNLKLSGTGTKTAPATTLSILGNLSKTTACIFAHNNGTVSIDGTLAGTQTYTTVAPIMEFNNLINNNTNGGFTVGDDTGVQRMLTLNNNTKLIFGTGNIHLRSTATTTAAIAQVAANTASNISYAGTGRFSIERYLPAYKAWRFLATPIIMEAVPTISEAWREGNAPLTSTGFGVQLTGPSGPVIPTNTANLDLYSIRGSMKKFLPANTFAEVTDANTTPIANKEGYFVFVTGDRGTPLNGTASPTNLRMKGKIINGNQTYSVAALSFQSLGNPFASRVDFRTITNPTIAQSYYAWNPNPVGTFYNAGKYETYINYGDGNFRLGSSTGTIRNEIESGQAIIIQSITGGSITIEEADKATGSANVSRNVVASKSAYESRVEVTTPTLEINLFTKDINGSNLLADAATLQFDENFSNGLDNLDVRKISNAVDNLSVLADSKRLVLSRRSTLVSSDTIFLSLTSTRIATYYFQIDPSMLGTLPLQAWLIDKYLQTETPLSLNDVTDISFNITTDAASKLADRFMIIFRAAAPASFIAVTATANNNETISLQYKINNENNVAAYKIERSNNGNSFNEINSNTTIQNLQTNVTYEMIDVQPLKSDNYYRIKMILRNGNFLYSNVVKVNNIYVEPAITVTPNPVENKTIFVNFINKIGKFNAVLLSEDGKIILNTSFAINNIREKKTISIPINNSTGGYKLILIDKEGIKQILSFLVL